jgi:hypothetical protein
VTGVHLDGNAAAWWNHAEGHYDRGHQPSVGAILVFKPYGGMHVGHVAVVSQVVSSREVLVDQANWVRGRVTKAMSVVDASPLNDWTSVKVQYAGTHGRANPTYGFIYPKVLPASFGETIVEPQNDRHRADRVADEAKAQKDQDKPEQVAEKASADHVAENAKPAKSKRERVAVRQLDPAETAKQPGLATAAKKSEPAKTVETKTAETKAAETKAAETKVAKTKPAPHLAQNTPSAPVQPKPKAAETQVAVVY